MHKRYCLYCNKLLAENETDFHAKCCKRMFGTEKAPIIPYSIADMYQLAKDVVLHSVAVPGVQPKLSMGMVGTQLDGQRQNRLTIVGALGGNYIFKPPNKGFPQMPENEHLTMSLAELLGISVVPHSLIKLASGELGYITKRIDRTAQGEKIHLLDMYQILEATDKYRSSMEKVGKAVLDHTANTLYDALRLFELTFFSFLTGNNDMHLKNFSLIVDGGNQWSLAPAYDLLNVRLHIPEDREDLALTLHGKKSRLDKEDFLYFGTRLGLNGKQMGNIFKRFSSKQEKMQDMIETSYLSEEKKTAYKELLSLRLEQFP